MPTDYGFPELTRTASERYRPRFPRPAMTTQARSPELANFPLPFGGQPRAPAAPGTAPEGGGYDPSWAYGPGGEFSGNQLQQNLIMAAGRGGAFDPRGSQVLLNMIRRSLAQRGRARESRALTEAGAMAPNDPYFANYARESALQGSQNESERAISDAILQLMSGGQDFGRQLLLQYLTQVQNRRDPREPNPWAQAGGEVLGFATGGLLGGSKGGGGGGGSTPRMGNPDFRYPRY